MAVLFWLCQTKPVSKVPIWTINTGEAYKFDDLLRVLPCLSDHVISNSWLSYSDVPRT